MQLPFVTTNCPVLAFQSGNQSGWKYAWDLFFSEHDQASSPLGIAEKIVLCLAVTLKEVWQVLGAVPRAGDFGRLARRPDVLVEPGDADLPDPEDDGDHDDELNGSFHVGFFTLPDSS